MSKNNLTFCFDNSSLILTEGAVGLRVAREFDISPDENIKYAGLIYDSSGRKALKKIYSEYLQIAQDYDLPILLLTSTRRCNYKRVFQSKYKDKNIMSDNADFLYDLAKQFKCHTYIGGMMGCKGDAYSGASGLSTEEAIEFHSWQAEAFKDSKIDFLLAGIMPVLPETIGMAKVMERINLPYIISLMINKNGTLLDGNTINNTIQSIDYETKYHPLCYMTNCVHPTILEEALNKPFNNNDLVKQRFCGIQANAACLSPEELDDINDLKTSSAKELIDSFILLRNQFPLKIFGGCCGTDDAHIKEIAKRMHTVCKQSPVH